MMALETPFVNGSQLGWQRADTRAFTQILISPDRRMMEVTRQNSFLKHFKGIG